jgi:hypothetical protein
MLIALGATSNTARDQRVRAGLSAVAWAYLAASYRGDFNAASQVLSTFQLLYNEHKLTILSALPVAMQNALMSQTVRVGSGFDAYTRNALGAALISGGDLEGSVVSTMPTSASAVGSWFWTSAAPLYPIDSRDPAVLSIWGVDRLVRETSPMDISEAVASNFFGFAESLAVPPPPSGSAATTTRQVAPAPAQPLPSPLPTSDAAQRFMQRPAKKDLTKPIVAAVGLVAIGAMIFMAMKRRRR